MSPKDEIDKLMEELGQIEKDISTPITPQTTPVHAAPVIPAIESEIKSEVKSEPVETLNFETPPIDEDDLTHLDGNIQQEMEEFRGSHSEASMDEVLVDQSSEFEEENILPPPKTHSSQKIHLASVTPLKSISSSDPNSQPNDHPDTGCMTLSVSGHMVLKLKYDYDGQEIVVEFVDHCLKVYLSDGTEFKIPVNRKLALAA